MNESTDQAGGGPAPGPAPHDRPFGAGFFGWLRGLGITRTADRWLAGVAGGIAARANIDPIIVRGVFVVLALLGGPGILLYIAGWLLLPDASGRIHLEEVFRGRAGAAAVVAAVAVAGFVVVPFVLHVLGAGTVAGWGLWTWLGMPEWLATTMSVVFWIAVVSAFLYFGWLLIVKHGKDVRAREASDPGAARSTAGSAAGSAGDPAAGSAGYGTAGTAAGSAGSGITSAGDWGHRVSESAQRVGERAQAWGEDVSGRADDWSAKVAEQHERHALGAGHTVITLAVALLAAGGAALWALGRGLAASPLTTAALLAATATFAVSLIIAGVRGRYTGWVGFLSFCGVVALVFTSLLPAGSRFQPFGVMDVTASDRGSMLIAGSTRVDLGESIEGSSGMSGDAGGLDVVVLFGNTTVTLPEDRSYDVEVRVLAGNITGPSATGGAPISASGPILSRDFDSPGGGDPIAVTVTSLAGNVRVDGAAAHDAGENDEREAR